MDWRTWSYQKLINDGPVTAIVPEDSIFGSGSLDSSPKDRPFIVLKLGVSVRGPYPGALITELQVWAHDEPGDYLRIQSILEACQTALVGQVAEVGATSCRWSSDSQDLNDDGFGTIVRFSSYTLIGINPSGE